MRTLLAVTTYNQLPYTKKFLATFKEINIPGLDLLFIDDVSTDGTQRFLQKNKCDLLGRRTPRGLTYSWNLAYCKFKKEGYDVLILANNDVLVCKDSLEELIKVTHNNMLVCPLTTKHGAGHNWKNQAIRIHYPKVARLASKPENFKKVQKSLRSMTKKMNKFNGFFFAMSRKIITAEWDKGNLFNPKNVNVHQEGDLQGRMSEQPTLCLGSFIYHFKGVSFPKKGRKGGKDIRQDLKTFH
jgi:GT2 family glycosyltransferase